MRAWVGLALLLAAPAHAGPWTREGGSYYLKAAADGYWAAQFAQAGVESRDSDKFLGQQYQAYGEVGLPLPHPVQISVAAPLSVGMLWFQRFDLGARAFGRATVVRAGDLRVRPQVAILPDKPIALAVDVKVPMYQVETVCDQDPTFKALCPHPGDGQVDIAPWLLAGGGVANGKGFVEGGVGWLHRTEWYVGESSGIAYSDSVQLAAGGGLWTGKLLTMLKADANLAPKDDGATSQAVRLGPAILADVSDAVALEARVQADVWALHAPRGVGFGIGVSTRK